MATTSRDPFSRRAADAVGNSLQFIAIFLVNVRPHYVLCGFAKKVPVLATVVSEFEFQNIFEVGDFRGKQIAVLVTNLRGSALHMDKRPAADGGLSKGALQTIVGRGSSSSMRDRDGGKNNGNQDCASAIPLRIFASGVKKEIIAGRADLQGGSYGCTESRRRESRFSRARE